MKPLFYKFWKNITDSFSGRNLLFHFLAITCTYFIVTTDFDWKYFKFFTDSLLARILFSAAIVGGLFPILIPAILLSWGKIKKNVQLLNIGYALGEAAILGYLISTFYKIFTGRIPPPLNHVGQAIFDLTPLSHLNSSLLDTSHIFQFGLFRGGIFWGWPSSHATIAFAMAFTLWTLYPKNKTVKIITILYALYIGIGVSMTIHWFSDFVAGTFIGIAIGLVVGKAFQERYRNLIETKKTF